ncbi:hypothetical protein D3C85_1453210 [compost metagenome]
MAQQCLAGAAATVLVRNVQVFQIQAIAALPGGVIEEIHGEGNRCVVQAANQRLGRGLGAEQAVLDIGDRGHDFVFGLFINGQLSDERQNLRRVGRRGRANGQVQVELLRGGQCGRSKKLQGQLALVDSIC